MKRYISMVLALCLVAALSIPAMALELENKGEYRVRGFAYKNPAFDDQNKDTDSRYDHRLRMNHKITIADNLKLNFRWTAFDRPWGTEYPISNSTGTASDVTAGQYASPGYWYYETFLMNRAWMTYISPIGVFDVGRMIGGGWGLPFGDFEGDFNRIKYTLPLMDKKLALIGIIQKGAEREYGARRSDADTDVYYLVGNYKVESFSTGLLTAHVRKHNNEASEQNYYAAVPYFNGKFGPIGVLFEVGYEFGRNEDERATPGNDTEIAGLAIGAELNGQHGPFGWETGYGHVSGQDIRRLGATHPDRKFTLGNFAYGGLGEDWDKFVYMTDTSGVAILNYYGAYDSLLIGSADPRLMPAYGGVHIWYLGASFAPKDNLKFSALFGGARAVETAFSPRTGRAWVGEEYGKELDFKASWDITPNLNYAFNFGWFFAGDAMADVMGVPKNNVQDGCKVYHKLQVNF